MAKSSGKGFLTALGCMIGRVQGTVIQQHKLTKAGAAVVPCFLWLSLRHFYFFAHTDTGSAPPSSELCQKDMIKR